MSDLLVILLALPLLAGVVGLSAWRFKAPGVGGQIAIVGAGLLVLALGPVEPRWAETALISATAAVWAPLTWLSLRRRWVAGAVARGARNP